VSDVKTLIFRVCKGSYQVYLVSLQYIPQKETAVCNRPIEMLQILMLKRCKEGDL
jgi:hypothetical protein